MQGTPRVAVLLRYNNLFFHPSDVKTNTHRRVHFCSLFISLMSQLFCTLATIAVAVSLLFPSPLAGGTIARDAASIFQSIQRKYSETTNIQVTFTDKNNPSITGLLTVQRNNKFMIEFSDRVVICNGLTMWNYTPDKGKVIISNYIDGNDAISPQKLFLSFPRHYIPSLLREQRSSGSETVVLVLKPKNQQSIVGGLQRITMKLEPRTLEIAELEIFDGSNVRSWVISGLKTDVAVPDSSFEFIPADDIRVIDLR